MYQPPYKPVYREMPKRYAKPKIRPARKHVALTDALLDVDDIPRGYPVRFHVEARNGKHLLSRKLVTVDQ